MDIQLPAMSEIEALRELRADSDAGDAGHRRHGVGHGRGLLH